MRKKNLDRARNLLDSLTEEFVGGAVGGMNRDLKQDDDGVRVERLLLDLVRPDPVQPRRVLPENIHTAFHSQQITPTRAMKEIVRLAQIAARQKGRPFESVVEILGVPEDEEGISFEDLSPEERLLHELVTLAISIRDDGQVNPITVIDVSDGPQRLYRIETGERRYWASWLLRDFFPGYIGDRMIDCLIIPPERYSPFRQARENSAREGLSAIALARQAGLLVIAANGGSIPDQLVDNDFYRQALDMRIPREEADTVYMSMGGINKRRFSQLKGLLKLSDESMELADRHNVEEKKLRPIIQLEPEYHLEVVRQIIEFNLTAAQVRAICEDGIRDDIEIVDDEEMPISRQAMQIAKALGKDLLAHDLARAFFKVNRNNRDAARAYAHTMRRLADELETYL